MDVPLTLGHAATGRFFELSLDMLCIADNNGYFKVINPAWSHLLGYTTEELLAAPFVSFVHPDDVAGTVSESQKLAEGAPTIYFENRYRCKDGTYKWLAWTSSPSPEGLIYAIARDITEQKHAEATRNQLASIVQSSDDAIFSKDMNGIITSWNAGAERIYGYTANEVIGRHASLLFPEDRKGELDNILARIKQDERIDHYETQRLHKTGSLLTVSLSVSPIYDATGKVIGASKIARDITRQKRTEEALRANQAQLQAILD